MEKIPIPKLQELANMLHEEGNTSLRNKMSGWVTEMAADNGHVSIGGLCSLADNSQIKDKIMGWVSNVTTQKPEFIYVPDTPMEMVEEPKVEEEPPIPQEIIEEAPQEITEEVSPEIKPKRIRKKKED